METAEVVRAARRENGPLTCANIAIFGPTDAPSARQVLDWPHWITRNLYAPVQLMIGKFWIGEVEDDKHQQPIMSPPVSFFSIRHSVPAKDARFLGNLPDVAAMLAQADDDGHDVLIPHLGVPCTPDTVIANYDTLVASFPVPARAQAP